MRAADARDFPSLEPLIPPGFEMGQWRLSIVGYRRGCYAGDATTRKVSLVPTGSVTTWKGPA